MSFVLTGATSPPAIRRRVASPEADTPSYWPVRMSVTISSDVLPILTLTLQPVCCSKSDTQSTFGSVEPSSTYPAQAMRSTSPSPLPSFLRAFGRHGPCPLAPRPLAGADNPPPPPQAPTPTASTAAVTSAGSQ